MESRGGNGKKRAAAAARHVGPTGVKCLLCNSPIYNVCEHCSGAAALSNGDAPRPNHEAALLKIANEQKAQEADGSSESTFRYMLREGNKMLDKVTRNVASATDHLFGEEEEDIDQIVEEFKKAQLEKKN